MKEYLKNLDKIESSIDVNFNSFNLITVGSVVRFQYNDRINEMLSFDNKEQSLLCLKSYKNIILLNNLLVEIFNTYKIKKYNDFIFNINKKIIFSLENGYRYSVIERYYLKNKNDIINNYVNQIVKIIEKTIRSQFVENNFNYDINLITRLIAEITIRLQYKNALWNLSVMEYDTLVSRRSSLLLKLLY